MFKKKHLLIFLFYIQRINYLKPKLSKLSFTNNFTTQKLIIKLTKILNLQFLYQL